MMLSSINMSGINAAICIINVLGVLLALLDELTSKFSVTHVSDVLLATAKATHRRPEVKTSVVFRPQHVAPIKVADSRIRSPESSAMAPEYTETRSSGSMTGSNIPELIKNAAISSTNVAETDRVKSRAISCETEPGDQHNDTCGMQPSTTVSNCGDSEDTSSSTPDPAHVDAMSNDAQTSLDGDTQIKSCPASTQAKMHACSDERYDTVWLNSTGSYDPDASDKAVTEAPGQGSSITSLLSGPPSPELSDGPIVIDPRFDDVCTPDEITQAPSSSNITTSLDASQSPVQGDQNIDAMSEPDTSELDIRRASESDFSPKSFTSSTASTVASASSMSAPHEQNHGTSDEILGMEPEMDSFVNTQPVVDSQPHTPTDELASSKVDFRTLNLSLRPQCRVDYPRSNQMTSSSVGMTEWETYRPAAEIDATEWASQAWTTDDMLDFENIKSSATEFDRDGPNSSTTCERDPKRLQGPAKFESFGSANPHQDVYKMTQQEVSGSLARPSLTADTSSVPATPLERFAAASTPTRIFCVTIPLNNNNSCDAEEAKVMPDQYFAVQAYNGNAYPCAMSQDKEDRRVHTYRPNFHTIAALLVEERNVTKSKLTDSEPDVIDTSFISQAVRQHAESQKKGRQAANHGSSHRGKKSKKSNKKTGRLNKERACVEKVLQPANEETIDTPDTLDKLEENIADSESPKDGCEQDMTSKESSKKKGKRRPRRQKKSLDTQSEPSVLATSMLVDEQTSEKHGSSSGETGGIQATDKEGCSCLEAAANHCDEVELNTKPLEDSITMKCAVMTLESPKDPSTNVLEAADDHVKNFVSDACTEAITLPICHNAVEAAQDETSIKALKASAIPPEEDETIPAQGDIPVTVHDTITETTTNGDIHGGVGHATAAHETVGQPNHLGKSTLTPILEEVEPDTDPSANDAGIEFCQTVSRLAAPEPAAPSSYREAMSASASTPSNIEADNDMQLIRFVQQEPLQQGAIEYYTEPAAYHEYPRPTHAYNQGTWPNYGPEPIRNYYHPKEPHFSYQYPFSNQLPEYYTPYYDYEPYAGYPQPEYFESFYDQGCGFLQQLPLSCYEPNGYATPYRARISWQEWQPYAERYPGQPFGTRTHMKEQKDKPWYPQTLGYEEELEEEFETGELTQRERTRRSCRKYGL